MHRTATDLIMLLERTTQKRWWLDSIHLFGQPSGNYRRLVSFHIAIVHPVLLVARLGWKVPSFRFECME